MAAALEQLTEKEKEALRLIVRGHDAKSAATELDISVHTINDRLRHARRKLDVTSSREAARLLFESEGGAPESLVHEALGDAQTGAPTHNISSSGPAQTQGYEKARNLAPWIGGVLIMSILIAAVAAALMSPAAEAPEEFSQSVSAPAQAQSVVLDTLDPMAREWLALIDAGNWGDGHAVADPAFRQALPLSQFEAAMQTTRVPLGPVKQREFLQFGSVNAPPSAYRVVQFMTDFEVRDGVLETVTFREVDGVYAVSGYFIQEADEIQGSDADAQSEAVAREWLALVDQSDWKASYDAAGSTFQKPNTVATWKAASEMARVPLGEVLSRKVISVNDIASPEGYRAVQFRTDFANRTSVVESVTLEREGGEWRVVGYFIQ